MTYNVLSISVFNLRVLSGLGIQWHYPDILLFMYNIYIIAKWTIIKIYNRLDLPYKNYNKNLPIFSLIKMHNKIVMILLLYIYN